VIADTGEARGSGYPKEQESNYPTSNGLSHEDHYAKDSTQEGPANQLPKTTLGHLCPLHSLKLTPQREDNQEQCSKEKSKMVGKSKLSETEQMIQEELGVHMHSH